ncbi:MAG: serine O-acetyltransferase [Flavobacteriia bacterium]|nr:serine O-acetyltransferase [Flavobacteriia bacterium]
MIISEVNFIEIIKFWMSKSIFDFDVNIDNKAIIIETLTIFLSDYQRYYPDDNQIYLENVLNRTELQGILLYRLARNLFLSNNFKGADACSNLGRFLSGFEIYYSAKIGTGLKINHGLGTVIGAKTVIGDRALIHQGVTFGDKNGGRPTVGNDVIVYPGAKILGQINIGCNTVIAANCVCFIDIPENTTAVGVPARILKK